MVDYGELNISFTEDVNDGFVCYSFEIADRFTFDQLIHDLIGYGLLRLGYLDKYEPICEFRKDEDYDF